jgi:hypothetical protein
LDCQTATRSGNQKRQPEAATRSGKKRNFLPRAKISEPAPEEFLVGVGALSPALSSGIMRRGRNPGRGAALSAGEDGKKIGVNG